MDFTISSEQIMYLCGLFAAIWGVVKVIREWKKPADDLKKQVDENTEHLDKDNKRLNEIEEGQKVMVRSVLALTDHIITGNNIDKLKKAKEEMQDFLITK